MAGQRSTNPSPSVLTPKSLSHLLLHAEEELGASVRTQTGPELRMVWRERGFFTPKSCVWRVRRTGVFLQQPCEATALPWPC